MRLRRPLAAIALAAALGVLPVAAAGALAHETAPERARTVSTSASVLERGSRGAAVRTLQRALGIRADGVFGPATGRAVRSFQRRRGLVVDGIAGPATLRALGLRVTRRTARTRSSSHVDARLADIARCESGGNPRAVSRDGRYRGKYQFSRATWRSVGGKGDPARASEAEQDRRAAALWRRQGPSAWPSCARRAR